MMIMKFIMLIIKFYNQHNKLHYYLCTIIIIIIINL
jgi:hypothetical protein